MIGTLFLLPATGSDFAAQQRAFTRVGLALAEGDSAAVHFARRGPPERLAACVRAQLIDLVVALDCEPIDPLVAALKRAGARAFVCLQGTPARGPVPRWKGLLQRLRFAAARGKADAVIFESNVLLERAVRCLSRDRLELVPPAVRTELFLPAASRYAHDVLGIDRRRRVFVFPGQTGDGVHVLLEAALDVLRRRDDAAFVLCGNPTVLPSPSPHIVFAGCRDDLPRLFPSCYAGVIASTGWDCVTRTALEMAACGLPVIASNLPGLAEAVRDGQTGLLFPPGDAGALAARIDALLDNPALALELGRAGRLRMERELSEEAHALRLEEVLRRRLSVFARPRALLKAA